MPRGVPKSHLHVLDLGTPSRQLEPLQSLPSLRPSQSLPPLQVSQPPEDTRRSPRKRKEATWFESEPFQRSPGKRRRQVDERHQRTVTQELEEENVELDADGSTDPDFYTQNTASRRRASGTPSAPPPPKTSTPPAPHKRKKGRQLGQKLNYGQRLTEEDDVILANMCVARSAKYGIETMQRFWDKIRKRFETAIGRKYVDVSRRMKHLVSKRKADIRASHKSGHAARDDDWTQAIDGWMPTFAAYQKAKNQKSSSRKRKMKENAKHEKRRDRLSQRLKDKPNYEVSSSSSFSSSAASVSSGESSENQSNSEDSSSSISSDAEENAGESELVTGTSPLPNNDAMMTGGLGYEEDMNNNWRAGVWALSEDDDDYPPIPSEPPPNGSTSPEPIERQGSKTARQSRSGRKTPKRSKQTRVSVTDNKGLDVLQDTLIDYFKDRTSSTRDSSGQGSLLKKIEGTLERHLTEHTAEVSELRRYFKESLHEYHKKHVHPWWNNLFEGLAGLSEDIEGLKQLYRSSREGFVASNARKEGFAADNASDEEVEAGNASGEEVVASDKRNRKRRTTDNPDLRE